MCQCGQRDTRREIVASSRPRRSVAPAPEPPPPVKSGIPEVRAVPRPVPEIGRRDG